MSDKYKITSEELNQILMHSPYALSTSPSERGMSGDQIKNFFYDFIRVLTAKLNIHLGDVGTGIERDILAVKTMLDSTISSHNVGKNSHEDMRNEITEAYNLAKGRSRVHPVADWQGMCDLLLAKDVRVGDFVVIAKSGVPDFVVQEINAEEHEGDIPFYANMKNVHIEPGNSYYFIDGKVRLLPLESGIDLRMLISREEYIASKNEILGQISDHASDGNAHEDIRALVSNAYDLARGKTKVHINLSFRDAVSQLNYDNSVNEGDILMVTDSGCPDFVVASRSYKSAAEVITNEMVQEGGMPIPEVGKLYYCEGADKVIIAIESGVDASAFATKDYVDALVGDIESNANAYTEELFESYSNTQGEVIRNALTNFESYMDSKHATKEEIGDILTELHNYAVSLKGGEAQ